MAAGLVAFASLLGSGYALQKKTNDIDQPRLPKGEIPTTNTLLSSTGVDNANAILKQRATNAYNNPQTYIKTNTKQLDTMHKGYYSTLADIYMTADDFKHANMTPSFGSTVRQNLNPNANNALMETFTGIGDTFQDKKEIGSMFGPQKGLSNVNGQDNTLNFAQSRIVMPKFQNNIFPLQQVKVGPGIGEGYVSQPSGGFQQPATLDILKTAKGIDELRVATKPQVTYSHPVVTGSAHIKSRGTVATVVKQHTETFTEMPFTYQVPSGGVAKETKYGCFVAPDTDRGHEEEYLAPAASKDKAPKQYSEVQGDRRDEVREGTLGPAHRAREGNGDDYGRRYTHVPMTTRELTVECSAPGMLTALVKAIIAPLQDVLKPSNNEFNILAAREFGNLQAQTPAKATVYDPSDVAKVTMKETMLHDSENLNLKGPDRGYVVDPSDVAKTTIKETLIHDTHTGIATGNRCIAVYNSDAARTTVRETLPQTDGTVNLKGAEKGVLPFNDKARVTVRETTIRPARAGNITTMADGDGYMLQNFDMRHTQRLTTSQGTADASKRNQGYDVANPLAKFVQRQVMCDNDYYGVAGEANSKEMMSYLAGENARIEQTKEMTLVGRPMTFSGPKQVVNKGMIGTVLDRQEGGCNVALGNPHGHNKIVGRDMVAMPMTRQDYVDGDRIERHMMDQLRSNPLALPAWQQGAPLASTKQCNTQKQTLRQ